MWLLRCRVQNFDDCTTFGIHPLPADQQTMLAVEKPCRLEGNWTFFIHSVDSERGIRNDSNLRKCDATFFSMKDPHILIIGAGLGGLTAALALQKAVFGVSVYEQAD